MYFWRGIKFHLGFLIISLLMVVTGLYAYCVPDQQKQEAEWVTHTQEVLNQLETLSTHMAQAETGQRGYLLTGQAVYLRPYDLALQQIDTDLAQLQLLTQDNSIQSAQIPRLREIIVAKVTGLKDSVDIRRSVGAEAALKLVLSGQGRQRMEAIQSRIDQMQLEEKFLLKQRIERAHEAAARTRRIFLSGMLLLYVMVGIVYATMQQEARRRKQLLEAERRATHVQRQEAERLLNIVAIQRDIAFAQTDLQTTMQTITARTQEVTQAEGGVVEMIEGDEMVYRAVSGTLLPHLGMRLKAATSLSGRCVRENIIFKCDDAETDDRVDREACRKVNVRSMVVVPLRSNGQAIGALKVMASQASAFTEQDVATLELMAGVLSASLGAAAATQALRDSRQSLEEAQQVSHVGSWEFDLVSRKITWSKEMFRLLGLDPEVGEPEYTENLALFTLESAVCLEKSVQRAVYQGKGYAVDLQKAGTSLEASRWYHAIGKPIKDDQGAVTRLVGTLLEVTERKKHAAEMKAANEWLSDANALLEAQIARIREQSIELEAQKAALEASNARFETLAATDGLTGLKNRRALQERLTEEFQRALRHNTPLSILILDVDYFKAFNDKFGHPEGDTVLVRVAEILQEIARSSDVAARYGGEEFVLVLPETDAAGANTIAERLRQAIAEEPWPQRAITVSIGAATSSLDANSVQTLIDLADKALYRSKNRGRDCVTHANELVSISAVVGAGPLLTSDEPLGLAAVSGVLIRPQSSRLEASLEVST